MINLTSKNEDLTKVGLLLFCGFLSFMINPTAYTWGEQDMMPFFERFQDPDFIPGDFFTNSTMISNPRWVYGYFIAGISSITGISWYNTLYAGKLLLLLVMPVLHYKVMIALLARYLPADKLANVSWFILLATIFTVLFKEYRQVFSIALWEHYKPVLNSANISMALCFVAILIKEARNSSIFYLPLFALGTFFHPAMGIFCILFYLGFLLPQLRKEWVPVLKILACGLLTAVFVKLFFSTTVQLSTAEFIEFYVVERHPWHYQVSKFDHWLGNWHYFFLLMNILLWGSIIFGLVKKDKNLVQLGLISAAGYLGSVLFQYLFVEIYPLKLMAYLGVTRYSIFGYWSMLVLWAYALSYLNKNRKIIKLPVLSYGAVILLLINFLILGILYRDNPTKVKSRNWRDFYSFVHSTSSGSTFLTFSKRLNTDLRIIGKRPVFISREFPFVESEIYEHTMRQRLAFGSKFSGLEDIAFYRTRTPRDFKEMADYYPLDYIVVEAEHSASFDQYEPVWSNSNIKAFALEDLK